MYLIYSFILIVVVITYLIVYSQPLFQEGFAGYSPKYCGDCNTIGQKKGINGCMACNNCGWCVDPNGFGSCVLGDFNGPYFADCAQYFYNGGTAFSGPPVYPTQQGNVKAPVVPPYGPATVPWYQMLLVPWYGGFGQGSINPSPSYWGNTFYNNYTPLKSARRYRPTGDYRMMF